MSHPSAPASEAAPTRVGRPGEVPLVVRLRDDRADRGALGGKGAALGRLVDEHFPVPDTVVVTVDAYRAVIGAPGIEALIDRVRSGEQLPAELVDATFSDAPLADGIEAPIVGQVRAVGAGGPVAVRSSATVEDLHGSSFAGQYRSLLDVDSADPDAVMRAVRLVWASLWHPAPVAYRRAFDIDESEIAMAVVVMRMVPATTAGVVFTSDPGGTGGARIEAVEGLGESLVSGGRTPSAWVVPTGGPHPPDMPTAAIRALEVSLDVADRFGVPQDVEWAAVGDEIHVVQARPITVLDDDDGFDTPVDDHELTTAGIVEMVPGVLPPLRWDLNRFLLEEAFRSVLDSLGVISGSDAELRPLVRRVRGRAVVDFDQLLEITSRIPGAAQDLEHQYFGEHPTELDPGAPARSDDGNDGGRATGEGRLARLGREWGTVRARRRLIEQADVSTRAVRALRRRRPEIAGMTDRDLLAYSHRLVDLGARALSAELGVAAAAAAGYARLVGELERHLGQEEGESAAQAVIARSGAAAERPASSSAGVFAGPTWQELGIAPPVFDPVDAAPEGAAVAALRDRLTGLPGWTRRRVLTGQFVDVRIHLIRRVVADVVEQLRRRESTKAAFLELGGEVRSVHLELGRRLVDRSQLEQATDVELLTVGELERAVSAGSVVRPDDLRRRRNWITRYESEGELPDRFVGVPDREPAPLPEGDVLHGWAASPGRYEGVARVLTDAREPIEPGQVLVAAATDASWSPLFVKAGAVIVERGGPLSHAAILARELGLPAVLNLAGATRLLDGCTVTVDGGLGVVVIEQRRTEPTRSDSCECAP